MINRNDLQVGDLFFYEAKDLLGHTIGFFSDLFHPLRPKVSHISGCSEIKKGYIDIIESHLGSGVVELKLKDKYYKSIIHCRLNPELTKEEKKILVDSMRKNVVGRGYDAASFLSKFIRSYVFSKETPLLNDKGAFDCAETWAWSILNYLKRRVCQTNVHTVSPNALLYQGLKNKTLTRIS